jgi:hypothetical protein
MMSTPAAPYYVVRMGLWPGDGAYVTFCDGDDYRASSRQREAYRWATRDKVFAELASVALGAARVVRVVPRTTQATSRKDGNG